VTNDLFTSRPLADAQKQYAQTSAATGQDEPQRTVRPQPIVDINLDEVPETDYAPFTFQLKGNVYTLGIDDDQVLFEIAEMSMDEVGPNELFAVFFERTFRKGVDENGNELNDGLGVLLQVIQPRPRDGSRPIPRQSLLRILNTAVDGWMEELTDVSMRPNRRARRRR
jgi:hypothetical protein